MGGEAPPWFPRVQRGFASEGLFFYPIFLRVGGSKI